MKFGKLKGLGVFRVLFHFIYSSERATHNLGFLRDFLGCFSLYVVLGAGRAQFGIFGGVFRVLFHFI